MKKVKVIAFDCFNTVFDMASLKESNPELIAQYVEATKGKKGEDFKPHEFPPPWYDLKAHPDSKIGLYLLRYYGMKVCALSNGPTDLIVELSRKNDLQWDFIVPLELVKAYKCCPEAYMAVPQLMRVEPSEVLMVTANEKFGDLEAAKNLGMHSVLIRDSLIPTIHDLAELIYFYHFDNLPYDWVYNEPGI